MKNILLALVLLLTVLTACTDGDSMRRQLQELQARNQADSLLTDLPLATSLCDYFDSHGSPNERMLAHYLLGRTHADRGEAPEALEAYHSAAECADTTNLDSLGTHLLSRIYGQMGELFYRQELFPNALDAIVHAEHYALSCHENAIAVNYFSQRAKCYYHLGKIDSAVYVSEQAARRFYELNDTLSGNTCLGLVAYHYIDCNDLERGYDNLVKFEKHSWVNEESMKYNEPWKLLYVYKGLYFLKTGQMDSSLYYFNKELEVSSDPNNNTLAYRGLYQTYEAMGNESSASHFAVRYAEASDSTNKLSTALALLSLEQLYNYSRFRELSNRKTIEAQNLHIQMTVLVFVTFVVVLLLIFAYFHQVSKKKMLRQRMNAKYTADILSFLKICSDLEEIKNKDEKRRQELEAEMIIIKKSLSEVQEDQKSPDQWDVSLKLLEAPIVRHFHQMAAQGNTVTDEKWQELRSLCNLALPGFLESLAATGYYPNLVETQICLLIKLRFLMSEISTIVRLSPSALSNKRVRMLKKMYGTDGSSSDFDEKIRLLRFGSS